MHELKLIVDLLHEGGLEDARISDTAAWGDLVRVHVSSTHARARMQEVLDDIRDGTFAREWIAESEGGGEFKADDQDLEHPIEKVGAVAQPDGLAGASNRCGSTEPRKRCG